MSHAHVEVDVAANEGDSVRELFDLAQTVRRRAELAFGGFDDRIDLLGLAVLVFRRGLSAADGRAQRFDVVLDL